MDRLVIPKVGLSPSEKLYANGSSLHIESFRSLGIGQYFCNTSLCSAAIEKKAFLQELPEAMYGELPVPKRKQKGQLQRLNEDKEVLVYKPDSLFFTRLFVPERHK